MVPRSLARNGWNDGHLFGALAMVVVGAAATAGIWADLWRTALEHHEAGHLVLVALVMIVLIRARAARVRWCTRYGTWIGPLLVMGGWAAVGLGQSGEVKVLVHAGALAIVLGCLLSVAGWDMARKFLPALAALCLMVPIPWTIHEQVTRPFALAVADLSVMLYQAVGLSVHRLGGTLRFSDFSTPVLAVCGAAGLKAVFLVAFGFAFSKPLRGWVRVLILSATPLVTVICQIVGTLIVAWLVGVYQVDTSWLSTLSAWLILPAVFLMFIGLTKALTWAALPLRPYTLARGH